MEVENEHSIIDDRELIQPIQAILSQMNRAQGLKSASAGEIFESPLITLTKLRVVRCSALECGAPSVGQLPRAGENETFRFADFDCELSSNRCRGPHQLVASREHIHKLGGGLFQAGTSSASTFGSIFMRSVLICQHDAQLVREVMPRWLNSFTDLAGIVVLRDQQSQRWKKLQRSLKQDGLWGTLDLLAYRVFHRWRYRESDRAFERHTRETMAAKYAPVTESIPILETTKPNGSDVQLFLQQCRPDIMLACCKHILKPEVFEQATAGTYVMHPGICPEYRNAHGCFWALVNRDFDRVGMTLLKIDRGIDTGPVLGYFTAPYDEQSESHLTIQRRMTYQNLDGVRQLIEKHVSGELQSLSTQGRHSAIWGQPTLTSYLRWKSAARQLKGHLEREASFIESEEDRLEGSIEQNHPVCPVTLPSSTR